jgi:hypothetical protein
MIHFIKQLPHCGRTKKLHPPRVFNNFVGRTENSQQQLIQNALGDGGESVNMCCSTGGVLCDVQIVIIIDIFRLAPITGY